MKYLFLLICVFTFALPIYAQKENLSKDEKRVQKEITKKEREQIEKMLKTYTVCPTSETEFVVLGVRRVDKNTNHTLARETADGVKGISRTDSYDVLVTFKDKTRFANLRPDRSDPKQYETDKKVALENLQYYNNTGKFMSSSKPEEKTFNGFSTYSIYRSELIGNQLGTSLIFDDTNKMITTIYFINAPKNSNGNIYKTIEEWSTLRERFLDSYTSCVAKNLGETESVPK
ncbi:MAG: hypothetical protein C4325_11445 [Blastocatellia bacterium]